MNFDAITCIIGTNGFGKTSILNSIKLCLGHADVSIDSILNNNAKEPICGITLKFDIFTIERTWKFGNTREETLNIYFEDDHTIEGGEAEHFIQNKFPSFLIDFLFYDGEVGSNLFLLSRTKLKSLFDFIFDLDLLVNVQKDSAQVAKNLLEKNRDDETSELIELESKRIRFIQTIKDNKEEIELKIKERKILALNVQKLDTQIRNRNKKVKSFHEEQDIKQIELNKLSTNFKELIIFQMPLFLNNSLLQGMQARTHSPLKMNDEKLFANHFKRFLEQINANMKEDEALSTFTSLMLTESSSITLSMSQNKFTKLLENMKDLQFEIKQLQTKIEVAESSIMEQEITRSLMESREEQQSKLTQITHSIEDLENSVINNSEELKEINKELTKSFKANQERFAFIKGYEELQEVSKVSEMVYKEELQDKLLIFNQTLKRSTSTFLQQYEHINEIYIDEKHRIIIGDGKQSLDIELLSAGQKQVLNFLIVKSILEFKEFSSFVMVDTPFGRLSNENKTLLLNDCYLKFDNLSLLLTDSEFEFMQAQQLNYLTYDILQNDLGSKIEKRS
jgi:DNA sulfur modification protein DndD